MLIVAVILGKLLWDFLNDYRQNMQPTGPIPGHKKKRPGNGEVIDLSNAWINMDDLPYRKRDNLLSGKDLVLYELVDKMLDHSTYTAFPRVNLEDLVTVASDAENRTEYFNRIRNRYIDIVVCEREGLRPVLVVIGETNREPRKKQQLLEDRFIRNAADAAGLKYLPLNLNNLPDSEELGHLLKNSGINI
jgi:hypothetical protein